MTLCDLRLHIGPMQKIVGYTFPILRSARLFVMCKMLQSDIDHQQATLHHIPHRGCRFQCVTDKLTQLTPFAAGHSNDVGHLPQALWSLLLTLNRTRWDSIHFDINMMHPVDGFDHSVCFTLEFVLDRARWSCKLQAKADSASLLVDGQVLDEATLDNIHSKVWVNNLG